MSDIVTAEDVDVDGVSRVVQRYLWQSIEPKLRLLQLGNMRSYSRAAQVIAMRMILTSVLLRIERPKVREQMVS